MLQTNYLHTMQQAGRHLLALLNDMLGMAETTTQQLKLDYAPFNLAVALPGAGPVLTTLPEKKGLHLTVARRPGPLRARR